MAGVGAGIDLERKDVVGPALLGALAGVPEPLLRGSALLHQGDVVIPGDLCKSLLHDCPLRPCRSEGAHVFEVARREALHVGERLAQVRGQPVDDLRTPAFAFLPVEDDAADVPVVQDHRCVGGEDDPQALLLDVPLDLSEGLRVAARQLRTRRRHEERCPA